MEPLEDDYEHIKEYREKLRTMLRERNPSLVSDDAGGCCFDNLSQQSHIVDDDLALKNGKEKVRLAGLMYSFNSLSLSFSPTVHHLLARKARNTPIR